MKRKIITLSLVATMALSFAACGDSNTQSGGSAESSALAEQVEQDSSETLTKEEAEKVDRGMGSMTKAVMEQYDSLNGELSQATNLAEIINKASSVSDTAMKLRSQIENVWEDGRYQDYYDASRSLCSQVWAYAESVKEYASNPSDQSVLQDVQANSGAVATASATFLTERSNFLASAGFTEDEINALYDEL